MAVEAEVFGRMVCESLGIDPKTVQDVMILAEAGGKVKLTLRVLPGFGPLQEWADSGMLNHPSADINVIGIDTMGAEGVQRLQHGPDDELVNTVDYMNAMYGAEPEEADE